MNKICDGSALDKDPNWGSILNQQIILNGYIIRHWSVGQKDVFGDFSKNKFQCFNYKLVSNEYTSGLKCWRRINLGAPITSLKTFLWVTRSKRWRIITTTYSLRYFGRSSNCERVAYFCSVLRHFFVPPSACNTKKNWNFSKNWPPVAMVAIWPGRHKII